MHILLSAYLRSFSRPVQTGVRLVCYTYRFLCSSEQCEGGTACHKRKRENVNALKMQKSEVTVLKH